MCFAEAILSMEPALPARTDNLISRYALFLSHPSSHSGNELKLKHDEEFFRHLTAILDTDFNEVIYQVYTELMNIQLLKNMFDSQKLQRFLMHLVAEHLPNSVLICKFKDKMKFKRSTNQFTEFCVLEKSTLQHLYP